jgi:O-antigen/teichoic acid export membrane protein
MGQLRTIVKNSLVTYISHACEILTGILWVSLLGRYLGLAGLGKYALLYVILQIIIAFSDSGINSLLSRNIVRDKENAAHNFGAAIVIRSTVTFLFLFILFTVFLGLRGTTLWTPDWATVGALLLFTVSHFSVRTSCTIFWAYERMEFEALTKTINCCLMVVLLLFVRRWDLGLWGAFMALACAKLIAALVAGAIRSTKFIRPKFSKDLSLLKYYAREGLPLGISAVARKSYGQIDTIMLIIILKDFSPVGIFNGAYRLIQRLSMLPILVNRPLFPAIARSAKESKGKMEFICEKLFKFLVIISLPMTILIIAFAEEIILFLLGEKFVGSITVLQLLAPVIALMFVNFLFGYMLIALHRQKYYTWGMLSSFAANLILDLVLIPYVGYKGACVANLVSESILSITLYYFLTRHIQPLPLFKIASRPLLSGLGTGMFLYVCRELSVFTLLPSALLLYFVLLILLRTFTRDEIDLLKKNLRKQRTDAPEVADFAQVQTPASDIPK